MRVVHSTTYPCSVPSCVACLPGLLDANTNSDVVVEKRFDGTLFRQGETRQTVEDSVTIKGDKNDALTSIQGRV